MSLRKNYKDGYIGFSTSLGGIFDIETFYFRTPTVLYTSQADGSADLTLPSNISAGNVIIICAGSRLDINTPSGYTILNQHQQSTSGDPSLSTFYKVADGTEGGTTITSLLQDNSVSCAIVLETSNTFNIAGTAVRDSSDSVTVTSITPFYNSLVFLVSVCDQTSSNPSNDGGFTNIVVDGADGGGGAAKEIFVWSKVSDGTSTGNVTVTWSSSRVSAVMFSI